MFVDNKCAEYLTSAPLADEVTRNDCKIFSLRMRDEMLAHLEHIEIGASEEHAALVEQVYGPMPSGPPPAVRALKPRHDGPN